MTSAEIQQKVKGNPAAVLEAMTAYMRANRRMMTFQPSKLDIARTILAAQEPKPRTIVELGCYVGYSAVAWGAMLRDFHAGDASTDIKIYTCELDPKFVAIARQHIELAGLSDVVEVVEGESGESIRRLHAEGKLAAIDMLFLDHWEKHYLPDTQLCEELHLFHNGSIILADNTDMPGAPEYLAYIRAGGSGKPESLKYETKTYMAPESERGPVSHNSFTHNES